MTDLEKLQRILTHPDYKVVLNGSPSLGKHLYVYGTQYSKIFEGKYKEFRISRIDSTDSLVITPFLHDNSYDASLLLLTGDRVIRLFNLTMDILIKDAYIEALSSFNLPIEGDIK